MRRTILLSCAVPAFSLAFFGRISYNDEIRNNSSIVHVDQTGPGRTRSGRFSATKNPTAGLLFGLLFFLPVISPFFSAYARLSPGFQGFSGSTGIDFIYLLPVARL